MKTELLKTVYNSLKYSNMLHIIVVAYERPIALRLLIDSFLLQTCSNWEMDIVHDGPASKEVWKTIDLYKDKRIRFWQSEERYQNYGHPNRKAMLEMIKGDPLDYVLMTNDDNYYVPKFVEYFFDVCTPNVGFVYCNALTRVAYEDQITLDYRMLFTKVICGQIDMGSFIVRLDVAKSVGFIHSEFHADGLYAEECNRYRKLKGLELLYIDKPLFVHN